MTDLSAAACRDHDVSLFFDWDETRYEPLRDRQIQRALRVCEGCTVRAACAEAGRHEQFGIWGGKVKRRKNASRCGTLWAYNRGCRCELCMERRADYKRQRRAA